MAAQLISREGLQLYSLGDGLSPHKAQQPYTHAVQKVLNTRIL
jgi:hypothetical protein